MKTSKRHIPILVVAIVLILAGAAAYMIPAQNQASPVRILFPNAGGKVIFGHQVHQDAYLIDCQACHHDRGEDPQKPVACGKCHPAAFDENFTLDHQAELEGLVSCTRCHHAEFGQIHFDHAEHEDLTGGDCQSCHHDESIEPEPESCANCHETQGDESMPSLRDAAHTRCADCHQESFDTRLQGCADCHDVQDTTDSNGDYTPCSRCHTQPLESLLPTRTNAFHDQCQGCHKRTGTGPFGQDDCYQCHIR